MSRSLMMNNRDLAEPSGHPMQHQPTVSNNPILQDRARQRHRSEMRLKYLIGEKASTALIMRNEQLNRHQQSQNDDLSDVTNNRPSATN